MSEPGTTSGQPSSGPRVLLAGGGTAGHTSPLLATADALSALAPGIEILCVGTAKGLETRVVPEAGYRLELIPPVPLPRKPGKALAHVPSKLRTAIRAARALLDDFRPDVVVGYGGYVSVPVYLAARRRRIPIVVHEQNALPGIGNKVGARFAVLTATSFPQTPLPRATYVGLPLRPMIATLDRAALRAQARDFFGLDPDLPTLLVTGGSQGARRINQAIAQAQPALAAAGVQVVHVKGPKGEVEISPGPQAPPYVVVPYCDRMDFAYSAADLVVGRAGANSVSEAAALGLPAVFVPLAIGNGEQARNAAPVVAAGGGVLIDDAAFDAEAVTSQVLPLLTDPARLAAMSSAAQDLIPRDAAQVLARKILEIAQ